MPPDFETFKLVEGQEMFLTGQTLNALAAQDGNHELLDARGRFVLDEKFYRLTKEGIEEVE